MKRIASFIIASLFLSYNSAAQEISKDTIQIPEVEIESTEGANTLNRIDSTSLESPINLNLGDLLNKESHLFIKSYGIGSIASISLRGSGNSHTQLYWNGISINSSMNGSSDLSLYPLSFLDEVELNYGLKSLEFGSGGIGGAVQLNNKVNFEKRTLIELSNVVGSFGRNSLNAQIKLGNSKFQAVTKLIQTKASNNFSYKDLTVEGFPNSKVKNASLEQKGLLQSLHFRPKENHLIEGFMWVFDSERNLPPLITLRENKEQQKDESYRGMLSYKYYTSKSILSIKSAYLKESLTYKNERANVLSETKTSSLRSIASINTSYSDKIKLLAKVNVDLNVADSPSLIEKVQQERVSLFASIAYKLSKKLSIEPTIRQDFILKEDNFLLPSLLVNYKSSKAGIELYTLIGKNLKYPTLNDLYWQPFGNQNLKAEINNSIEIGSNYSKKIFYQSINLETSTSVFVADIENYIQWRPTAFGYWTPQNLEKVSTMGLEFSTKLKQLKAKVKKQVAFNYSYTKSVNKEKTHQFDKSVDKQLIYIPEHKLNLSFAAEYKLIKLELNHQYIGERYTSSDNTELLPYYNISDISLGKTVRIKQHLIELKFSVLNIFDTEYQAIEWRPMPNRNYLLKIKYQFNK